MTTLSERLDLLARLSQQAEAKQKSKRLTELTILIPQIEAEVERVKYNLATQERLLGEREDILLAQAEGKNSEARKAILLALKRGDREWHLLQNTLNGLKGQVVDANQSQHQLHREWQALSIQLGVFTATLGFLAGGDIVLNFREGENHAG